jgi:IPT/TIG domain
MAPRVKRFFLIAGFFYLSLGLWGCGGGGGGTTSPAPVVGNPVPVVTSVTPNSFSAVEAGNTITVTGSSFVSGAVVNLDGTALGTHFISATQLTATVPASAQTSAGMHSITVTNPTPAGGTSSPAVQVKITPTMANVSPSGGIVGSTLSVTVYGGDVKTAANNVLTFAQTGRTYTANATAAAPSGNAVALTVAVPAGLVPASPAVSLAAPSTISASVDSFTSANTVPFEVEPPPHAFTVSPPSAEQGTSLTVSLVGSNTLFSTDSTLSTDNAALTLSNVAVASPRLISATLTISTGAATGDHVLTASSNGDPIAFHFSVLPASTTPVVISSISTTSAPPLAPITITGTGLTAGGQVGSSLVLRYSYGSVVAEFPVEAVSDTDVDTLIPVLPDPTAGGLYTGNVNVQAIVDGRASNVLTFTLAPLPANSAPLGATTTAYVDMLSTLLTNEKSRLDALGVMPAGQAQSLDSFFDAASSALTDYRQQVATAVAGGTVTAPDGTTFSKDAVDVLDRLLQSSGVISGEALGVAKIAQMAEGNYVTLGTVSDSLEAAAGTFCQGIAVTSKISTFVRYASWGACLGSLIPVAAPVLGPICGLLQLTQAAFTVMDYMHLACEIFPTSLASVAFSPAAAQNFFVGGSGQEESATGMFETDPAASTDVGTTVLGEVLKHVLPDSVVRLIVGNKVLATEFNSIIQEIIDRIAANVLDTAAPSAFGFSVNANLTPATVSLLPNPNGLVSIQNSPDNLGFDLTPTETAGMTQLDLDLSNFLTLDSSGNPTTESTQVSGNNLPVEVFTIVTVSPSSATLDLGTQQQFTWSVAGTSDQDVSWAVSSASDGSPGGTIITTGQNTDLYTAPITAGTYTITATSDFDHQTGSATVTVLNQAAVPVLNNVAPSLVKVGSFTLTLTGSGFLPGAQAYFDGTPLTTTFVSPTQVTASGTALSSQLGLVPVTIKNSGTALSNTVDVAVVASYGTSSGSTAVIAGDVGGKLVDKAYVPVPNSDLVSVINLDTTPGTNPVVTTIPIPNFYSPNATAADQSRMEVLAISYTSPDIQVIDASNDVLVTTLTAPVTTSVGFSGGSCMICGIAVDPATNKAILDTAQGYLVLDLSAQTFSSFLPAPPAENFGYNPNGLLVLSPTYGVSSFTGLQIFNLLGGTIFNLSSSVGPYPDAAAVDINTGIAAVPDEYTGDQYLLNMQGAVLNSATVPPSFTTPSTVFHINFTNCGSELYDWSLVSVESTSHLLFLGTEFADCAAVESLPAAPLVGTPPLPAVFRWGHVPIRPDGYLWNNGGDPHGIAVFTSVVDGKAYGFLVSDDANWVARIDLSALASAPNLSGGGPGEVDLSPYIVFFNTQ